MSVVTVEFSGRLDAKRCGLDVCTSWALVATHLLALVVGSDRVMELL